MNNKVELEGKILGIDKNKVIKKLESLGAEKILDSVTFIETYDITKSCTLTKKLLKKFPSKFSPIFNELFPFVQTGNTLLTQKAYLRLREEGGKSELILKYPGNGNTERIKAEREISINIDKKKEWINVQQMLAQLGFEQVMYQEKQRISYLYRKLQVRFDIDTWPFLPTYIEIEATNKKIIEQATRLIGHNPKKLQSIKAKELFKKYSILSTYLSFNRGSISVDIHELLQFMNRILEKRGISKNEIPIITHHYWEAELMGKVAHGIRKFCWDIQFYDQRKGKPKIISKRHASILVDGQKEIGPLAAKSAKRQKENQEILIPGERSKKAIEKAIRKGSVSLPIVIWGCLKLLAGDKI